MKTTAWSHLPNAVHVDRILASVKAHTEEWVEVWDAAHPDEWVAARVAAGDAAWAAERDAAWDAARTEAWVEARDAISALIAWDNSAQYLAMTSDELRVFYALSERPECLLLLPAAVAFEKIAVKELVVA